MSTPPSARTVAIAFALLAGLAAAGPQAQEYSNPVIPGDHPDPSIIRVGNEFWATATTSQWAPIFPLLRSRDLVNWRLEGAVFQQAPEWSQGSYWAPEIAEHNGKFFVYYTARRRNGPLCVAVATANAPAGPWTDRGPLVCQDVGSIDAVAVTDESGRRVLIWKEDGNSQKRPTPLWAQPLSEDGTALVGTPTEILRNEAPWEGHLVEGPFVQKRDGWLYLFYSAGACCGRKCDYRLGVARSRKLLGPWERHPGNPILQANETWKCPGHGSIVTLPDGRTFLLYHAYHPQDFEYAGRQALLDEVTWRDGWPVINEGRGPSTRARAPIAAQEKRTDTVVDEFDGGSLNPHWQWPWDRAPNVSRRDSILTLRASGRDPSDPADTIIARPAAVGDYTATVRVFRPSAQGAFAGLSIYGNAGNAIGLSLTTEGAVLWRRQKGAYQAVATVPTTAKAMDLRVIARGGSRFAFAINENSASWKPVGDWTPGGELPPWDLAVRIALAVGGPAGSEGRFAGFRVHRTQ